MYFEWTKFRLKNFVLLKKRNNKWKNTGNAYKQKKFQSKELEWEELEWEELEWEELEWE